MMPEKNILDSDYVIETDLSKKHTIDGLTDSYQVYRIRLDCLYYNDRNDRIATWISKYESEHGPLDPNSPEYNNTIHGMIVESNTDAFKKTKNNIKLYNQREAGVVLNDGRIVDGNRRFTCLRELSADNPEFNYFEAVILPYSYNDEGGKKAIKALELTLQLGTDKQVDYDPINRLVGIYRDLIEDGHAFTVKEYARYIDQKETEVKKLMEVAKLMVEYLEFINAPKQFYIAVNQNINGPLVEMQSILKKCPDEEKRETLKESMFCTLLYGKGDLTRLVRKYRKIADADLTPEFIENQANIVDAVVEKIGSIDEPITQKVISEHILNDVALENKIDRTLSNEFERISTLNAKEAPLNLIDAAIMKVSAIDHVALSIVDQKDELREKLKTLDQLVKDLQDEL